jgi:hypothetical protein
MTDWYERTIKALQLNGKGERTQESYARAVRMLSEFYEKTPGSCHCSGHIGLLNILKDTFNCRICGDRDLCLK